jgi:uncharacterized protein
MLYRRFGRTELQMPVFSCGGMRYQFKWQDVPQAEVPLDNQNNLEATIRRAVALGINHIETARGYGSSEMQLGQILPTFPREKLIVQTKVSPTPTAKEFRETFDQSLDYLKLDYVDLLGIHGLNNEALYDDTFKANGCLEVAQQLYWVFYPRPDSVDSTGDRHRCFRLHQFALVLHFPKQLACHFRCPTPRYGGLYY